MSTKEFRSRYIFNAGRTQLVLATTLAFVSGSASTVMAIPGTSEALEAANTVGGMSAQALLALVTLGSLALTFYCVKTMFGKMTDISVSLAQIADSMQDMQCVKEKARK